MAIDDVEPLWQREEALWTGAADLYRETLAGDAVMVFPRLVLSRDETIEAVDAGPRWSSVVFTSRRSQRIAADVVALIYSAEAARDGGDYAALVTSVYVRRDDSWQLVLHQQTP